MGPNNYPPAPMGGPPNGPMIPISSGAPTSCPPGAQPLPSNVLGKGSDRMDNQQYMQQSSQIYVFSKDWANRAAEAVMQNQFDSIIAWHEAQPETKKHLEVLQNEIIVGIREFANTDTVNNSLNFYTVFQYIIYIALNWFFFAKKKRN